MKTILRGAIAVAALVAVAAASAQEIKAKLGTSLPDTHPQTIGARKFAELADRKSNGRIKITVYSAAQLGSDQQMQAALRAGTQEFTVPSTATLANLVKEFSVIGLPFSFASEKQADAVLDGPFGKSLLAKLPDVGLVGLAYWENGFRFLTNSRRPVVKVEDMAGLKVRTMQNNLYIDLFNGLGANAVPMPVNELFTALETKAVDAQENPYTVIYAQKFYDVQKYVSTTGHAYDAQVLIASKKFWDGLSDADKQGLQKAATEAGLLQRQLLDEGDKEVVAKFEKAGVKVNAVSAEELKRIQDKLKPVTAKFAPQIGEDFLKEFNAEIEKARAAK